MPSRTGDVYDASRSQSLVRANTLAGSVKAMTVSMIIVIMAILAPSMHKYSSSIFAVKSTRTVDGYILTSRRVVLPDGSVRAAAIIVGSDGRIKQVNDDLKKVNEGATTSARIVDYGDLVVMPGLIDVHVHANSPGKTHWEGFSSATKAAAAGGTTTILDMPLNSVPSSTDLYSMREKYKAMREESLFVDVGLIGGVIGGKVNRALELLEEGGVFALKSFLVDSQSQEFPHLSLVELRQAMQIIASQSKRVPYVLHAELPPDDFDVYAPYEGSATSYYDYLRSRPPKWEIDAVRTIVESAEETGCIVHIAHLSAAEAVRYIKSSDAMITSETCPHYLLWNSESIPDFSPEYKCAPPIRDAQNQKQLWAELLSGNIDLVASDHSPTVPHLKHTSNGNIRRAWGGIAGLQYRLAGLWSASKNAGGKNKLTISNVSKLLSSRPAEVFGLNGQKGTISPGKDADFVVWSPEETWTVKTETCFHRHKISPYLGRKLTGAVHSTIVRGKIAFNATSGFGRAKGKILFRHKNETVSTLSPAHGPPF